MSNLKSFSMEDVKITNGNFLNRQVCVPNEMDISTAGVFLNVKDECGTTSGWVFNEKLGVAKCAEDETRKHLCFTC